MSIRPEEFGIAPDGTDGNGEGEEQPTKPGLDLTGQKAGDLLHSYLKGLWDDGEPSPKIDFAALSRALAANRPKNIRLKPPGGAPRTLDDVSDVIKRLIAAASDGELRHYAELEGELKNPPKELAVYNPLQKLAVYNFNGKASQPSAPEAATTPKSPFSDNFRKRTLEGDLKVILGDLENPDIKK